MEDKPRIGVFICDCGSNIAGVLNMEELLHWSKSLNDVVIADEGKWTCSVDYIEKMKQLIQEHQLNRVVIAACTPRTHEPLFKRTIKEAGLNPHLLEFVSIREQSSWVHINEPEKATEKAKDLIAMGVAKARLLEEGEEIRLPVGNRCIVIGGGISGISSSLNLNEQGFHVTLIEKEKELGGILKNLHSIHNDGLSIKPQDILNVLISQLNESPNIDTIKGAEIEQINGYIGNYTITLRTDEGQKTIKGDTIIVATGMEEIKPEGLFLYGESPRVITQLELENMLNNNKISDFSNIVMINCVNSRNAHRGCCNIGCHIALKNALEIKEKDSMASVFILHRDLVMKEREGALIEKARMRGIRFIRFPDETYPEVISKNGNLMVRVQDLILKEEIELGADLLVLTVGFRGSRDTEKFRGQLKVSANSDNFLQEAHVKLNPLDFPSDGLYLAGCARSPKNTKESLEEAIGAGMRASIPMKRGYIETEGIIAKIDLSNCNKCGLCYKRCPFHAIKLDSEKYPHVIEALCKGCGLCSADCPKFCISIVHFTDEQIMAQVESALEREPEKKILGFVCHWCALGGVDMAGVSRLQYPPNSRLIRIMCSARVSLRMIERAFELGAGGVLVAGCEFPTCHYIEGNYAAEKRLKRAKTMLRKRGYNPERLWHLWCSAADGPKFANKIKEMCQALGLI